MEFARYGIVTGTGSNVQAADAVRCPLGGNLQQRQPPVCTGHADFNSPFETISFLRSIEHYETDIMLEAKAKDLALLRLRSDIARYAPDLAPRYNIDLLRAPEDAPEVLAAGDEPAAE